MYSYYPDENQPYSVRDGGVVGGGNDAAGEMWARSREAVNWPDGNPAEAAAATHRLMQESRTHAAMSVVAGGGVALKEGMTNFQSVARGAGGGIYEAAKWSPVGALISGAEAFQACLP